MRIIAGQLKRRLLKGPRGRRIRPVLDKVKGAIFNILGSVAGGRVLDLYAGTGSLGLEALSRGAIHATFVDDAKEAASIIRDNVDALKVSGSCEILLKSVPAALRFLAGRDLHFDLIFIDPPYDLGLINPALATIAEFNMLNDGGWIVTEHSPRELPSSPVLQLADVRSYGQTRVSFFTNAKEPV